MRRESLCPNVGGKRIAYSMTSKIKPSVRQLELRETAKLCETPPGAAIDVPCLQKEYKESIRVATRTETTINERGCPLGG